jgi:asparagine synthase (glutamine-hydrolysing)
VCGLAGFVLSPPTLAHTEIEARLWVMIGTLRQRGPDDAGVWIDGRGALALARLSIIDLSRAGHQPIASTSGRRRRPMVQCCAGGC